MVDRIFGDLSVKVVRGVNLQNFTVFGRCNPYVIVKLKSSQDSMSTSVKDGQANPSWMDTFIFRNVSASDKLQVSLMEKEGPKEGVVSVSEYLPSATWGFSGATSVEHVLELEMPRATPKAGMPGMGTIILKLQYRARLVFRPIFGPAKIAVAKTGIVTEKMNIDIVVDKALDMIRTAVEVIGEATGSMTKVGKVACGGAAAAIGGGVSMGLVSLAVPAFFVSLLFLPLTLMGGFFLCVTAMLLVPIAVSLGWLVFCSKPVQHRLWMPTVFRAIIQFPTAHKILIQPSQRPPRSGQ